MHALVLLKHNILLNLDCEIFLNHVSPCCALKIWECLQWDERKLHSSY